MNPVKIGIIGLGTVGCGTVKVLHRNVDEISRRAGRKIAVTAAAVRDLDRARDCPMQGIRLTTEPQDIVSDPDIDIVVELMGGEEPARQLVLQAIANGKHVITANKALIALHGNEIFRAAHEHGVTVAFEAAVGGGIPIIKVLREGLAANRINWLAGIINGTTNFILTGMRENNSEFSEELQLAQQLGYAETDPGFDVDGIDAAHKLTILASIAFGIPLNFQHTYVEGIREVTRSDVLYAEELGYRIKHLGVARRTEQGIELRVHPCLLPASRLMANVDGVMNAIVVDGDALGPTLYYGAGAGAEATASAVVADLVDVVRALTADPGNRVPHLAFQADAIKNLPIVPMSEVQCAYYLRLQAADQAGVLADVTRILGDQQISIESIIQKNKSTDSVTVPIVLLTYPTRESAMDRAIVLLRSLASLSGTIMRIRVESLK